MRDVVLKWARQNQIHLQWPEKFSRKSSTSEAFLSLAEKYDFEKNPCIDYGKFIEAVPQFVLKPATLDQLVACVVFLKHHLIPYKTRGSAHSSGGQVLIEQGAVLDLSGLSQIVQDYPEQDEIWVDGGIWWLDVAEYLHHHRRRPVVLTDNYRTTVAGTLSVGGFGDTTHLYGLQIETVTELTVVMPDGGVICLRPNDDLFQYILAGRGQLGIIGGAKLKTLNRPSMLNARIARWNSIPNYEIGRAHV